MDEKGTFQDCPPSVCTSTGNYKGSYNAWRCSGAPWHEPIRAQLSMSTVPKTPSIHRHTFLTIIYTWWDSTFAFSWFRGTEAAIWWEWGKVVLQSRSTCYDCTLHATCPPPLEPISSERIQSKSCLAPPWNVNEQNYTDFVPQTSPPHWSIVTCMHASKHGT